MPPSTDLLQGTLDMLILKTLAPGQEHGWAIAKESRRCRTTFCRSGKVRCIRLCTGWNIAAGFGRTWGASENNRRARFYALTAAGRKQLEAELENWDRLTGAVNLVLQGA